MHQIRVLHVIGIMNRGGAETMIMNYYRHIDHQRVQFDFVENENDGAFFDEEIQKLGGRIFHCPKFSGINYIIYRKWWKSFFTNHREYSFVHGHIGSTASIYLAEARKQGIITIAHSHGIKSVGFRQYLYDILSYRTRYIADYLFMCSRQAGLDRFGLHAISSHNRAFLIPNCIKADDFRYDELIRNRKRNELLLDESVLLFGHVGRLVEVKNHEFILNVFQEINTMVPSSRLLFVGDGELRSDIERRIELLGLKNKVILAGDRSDVNELLMAMDVMIFPSKNEGLPVTLVEAQCSGLPCVISDKVPSDSVLIESLVSVRSLNDSTKEWATTALRGCLVNRSECADMIKRAGFDIESKSKWLEDFYCEKAK